MSDLLYDNILTISYLILWVVTFVCYHLKSFKFDAGSFIIMMYVVYASFSVVSINDELFSFAFFPLKLFPFIYLYCMLMLALSPSWYYHNNPSTSIRDPHTRVLAMLAVVLIVTGLMLIPEIISNASTGLMKIATDADAGKDAYMEQMSDVADSGSKIRNLPAVIYNALSDLIPFLCFYFLTKKEKNYVLVSGLLLVLLVGLVMQVSKGQRGGLIMTTLTAIGGYLLFKRYISSVINRIISIIGYVLMTMIAIPIISITMGRFGNEQGGVFGFISWYIGQGSLYFNNHALDPGGIRYGDRTFNMVKRIFDPTTSHNFAERRDKYHNLEINDNFFTTFVGDFTIDFGPVVAVLIFLAFNYFVLKRLKPVNGVHSVQQILLLYFTICISLQGGMALFSYSDTGNLRVLMFILLYAYLCYHDILLKKFPLKTSKKDETNNN